MPGPAFPPKVSFETGTTTTKARGQETHRGSQPGYTPWRDLPGRKGSSRGPGGASVPPGAALRASAAGGGARERGRDGEDLAVARRGGPLRPPVWRGLYSRRRRPPRVRRE